MTKNKMPVRKAIALAWRNMGVWRRYRPGSVFTNIMSALLSSAVPLVSVYFSAQVLNALTRGEAGSRLWRLAALALGVTAAVTMAAKVFCHRQEIESKMIWWTFDKVLGDKRARMDFVDADSQRVADMVSQIEQNRSWNGWGLTHTMESLKQVSGALTSIVMGLGLSVTLFTRRVEAGEMAFLDHPLFILLILAVLMLAAFAIGRLQGYSSSGFSRFSEAARLGNRMFFSYGNFSAYRGRAMDIRIYRQDRVAQAYTRNEGSIMRSFAPVDRFYRRSGGAAAVGGRSLAILLTGGIYLFVCAKAWAGAFPIGSAAQYIGALTAVFTGLSALMQSVAEMRENASFLADTFAYLDLPNDMYQGSLTTEKRSDRQYEVEFRDVSFRYPGAKDWALRHVDLRFRVGSRLAVVGRNGSGKTTFIKLLCRLYDPTEGEILLNGINIRKYRYDEYMNIFSVVFQDFRLFALPLGENVAGSAHCDRARAEACLRQAGFGERLDQMSAGLDAYLYKTLEKDGVEISGGEAQKIAIARALYKDAAFIVLDEPTAALDPVAEADIYARFNAIAGDRTAVYISHRLSSCRFCDEIAVFDQGRIVQKGAHEALLADREGLYFRLWNAQAQYYQ